MVIDQPVCYYNVEDWRPLCLLEVAGHKLRLVRKREGADASQWMACGPGALLFTPNAQQPPSPRIPHYPHSNILESGGRVRSPVDGDSSPQAKSGMRPPHSKPTLNHSWPTLHHAEPGLKCRTWKHLPDVLCWIDLVEVAGKWRAVKAVPFV